HDVRARCHRVRVLDVEGGLDRPELELPGAGRAASATGSTVSEGGAGTPKYPSKRARSDSRAGSPYGVRITIVWPEPSRLAGKSYARANSAGPKHAGGPGPKMHGRLTKPEPAAAAVAAARQRQTAATATATSRGLETCTNILSPFCIRSEPPKHERLAASWPT